LSFLQFYFVELIDANVSTLTVLTSDGDRRKPAHRYALIGAFDEFEADPTASAMD
jgi:hypothetical protein